MRSAKLLAPLSSLLSIGALALACGGTATTTSTKPAPTAAPTGGDDDSTPPDTTPPVDNGAPSTDYPAPHPDMPQLVNQAGGKVLATPKVYLVFFPGYEHEDILTDLAQKVGTTTYWSATTKEYGVGALGYAGMIELTGETAPATITDTDIDTYMNQKIASGAFGDPDPSTIYSIVYPKTTTIQLSGQGPLGGGSSCSSFGGYHSDTTVALSAGGTKNFSYAVLPTCTTFGDLPEADGLTGAASHEWIEAVTDPFPSTNNGNDSAFSSVDQDHFIWIVGGGTEAADLCVSEDNAFFLSSEVSHTVQRSWSNAMAKAGHDPCAPNLPGVTFFNSAPVLDQSVTLQFPIQFGGGDAATSGVLIPIGQSKTIEIDLYSDGPTSGPWTVSAEDTLAALTGQAGTLGFAFDRTTGVNGEKLHLTITVKSASSYLPGAHPFTIVSKLGSQTFRWPALVTDS